MQLIKHLTLTILIVCSGLYAQESDTKTWFAEVAYNYMDGKANSHLNTAEDKTQFVSLAIGKHYEKYPLRVSLEYSPIKWKDAQVDILLVGVDYIQPFGANSFFIGVGAGALEFSGDPINEDKRGFTATIKTGINYTIYDSFYLNASVKYIHTSKAKIKEDEYLYSQLDNMIGANFGIGVRF